VAIGGACPIGTPHRSAASGDDRASPIEAVATALLAAVVERGAVPSSALRRAPLARTRIDEPSKATSTVPFVSVRYVSRAIDWSRSIVDGAGCP
jgi:hypothetical protein